MGLINENHGKLRTVLIRLGFSGHIVRNQEETLDISFSTEWLVYI